MSTNYTQNYSLCQWEPADKVLREDFNADNAKLDTALSRIETTANAAKRVADSTAGAAFTPERLPFVAGRFTGDGQASRLIELGFYPTAVLLFTGNGLTFVSPNCYGGLATRGMSTGAVAVSNTGFTVYVRDGGRGNDKNYSYNYIAFR